MFRHAIAPARFFSQVPNDIIRHPRLSSDAVRLLVWQLSLPPGADEPLSKTAKRAGIKKTGLTRAKAQLNAEGYFHEWRRQGRGGLWATEQMISNAPLTLAEARALRAGEPCSPPADAHPAAGRPESRSAARSQRNTVEKRSNPPSPAPPPYETAAPPPLIERAAGLMASISHSERRLRLNGGGVGQLAPLAAEWLLRGASAKYLREELTAGLPDRVHCAVALLRNRLVRKMPEIPAFAAPPPAPRPLRSCEGDCGRVFRPLKEETHCQGCRQAAAGAAMDDVSGAVAATRRGMTAIRTALGGTGALAADACP
ncbi:hypothetical protein [Streptomyces sp. ISL-11]|uniref:hypothetical protein n=1 Tax=Streptomyces sp. ISL-11 TaxID=2819174 RepID=UPI001BE5EC17|nr:hypothetical protein [Streptomyces sp. ISL-11]MBT2382812.1 hypothetical protein [Streptomyces sp. ISL-11]